MTIERMQRRTLIRGGMAVLGAAGLGTMGIGSAFAGSTRPQAATAPGWLPMPEKPQNLIASLTGQDVAPGSAVAISNSGGRFLSLNGYSDLEAQKPLQISDRFGFRSVTKSFVGTVILQLVAEGQLRLDDKISKFLPQAPNGDKITIEMALEMRTGLAEYVGSPGYMQQVSTTFVWNDELLLKDSFDEPTVSEPGTTFQYINTNPVVLGAIIKKITGNPWDVEVHRRISIPLGLGSVTNPADANHVAPAAKPYDRWGPISASDIYSNTLYSAAGALFGNIADLHTWGCALGSGLLLPPYLNAQRRVFASSGLGSGSIGYAYDSYGLAIGKNNDWVGHVGFGLGYEALTMHNPKNAATISILLNSYGSGLLRTVQLFRELIKI